MIPVLVLAGLAVGRWSFVPVAALGWVVIVVAMNGASELDGVLGAAGLAAANTTVGVAVHKAVATLRTAVGSVLRAARGAR